jgi:hypothetical protein
MVLYSNGLTTNVLKCASVRVFHSFGGKEVYSTLQMNSFFEMSVNALTEDFKCFVRHAPLEPPHDFLLLVARLLDICLCDTQ